MIPDTSSAFRRLEQKLCPSCQSLLMAGPCGGAAQNFYCINRSTCREGYSLTFWRGALAMAERIGQVDDARFNLYANKH